MSRMYRIRVSESLERLVHVDDGVATDLELLPILERGRMLELLAGALEKRGFVRDGNVATRDEGDGVVVSVGLESGRVTARVESERHVAVEGERAASVAKVTDAAEADLRNRLRQQLERDVAREEQLLQQEATQRLEKKVRDLQAEMDQVVNRVTAEALKERAAQLGEIEELHENAETGELTIKVKV
jgi:hypothetical protein